VGDASVVFKDRIVRYCGEDAEFSTQKENMISAYDLAVKAYLDGGSKEPVIPLYLKKSSAKVKRSETGS
jgi:hypothetical protein